MKKLKQGLKPFATYFSLGLVLIIVTTMVLRADPIIQTSTPLVAIRHEHVEVHNGNRIYRMVVSASAPNGFTLFGIVMSYDNDVVLPVYSSTFSDVTPPTNTNIETVTDAPFSLLATDLGFTPAPISWLVQNTRTGFSYDIYAIPGTNGGVATNDFIDVFAFYYRVAGNDFGAVNASTFRIENRNDAANSMLGTSPQTSFIRPGIKFLSNGTTYIWGPHTPSHTYTEIPDSYIILAPMPTPPTLPGDVNGDGTITAADVGLLRAYLAGFPVDIVRENADITGTGTITAADVGLLRAYLAGFDVVLGPPNN